MNLPRHPIRQQGLTLVELMIALTLGLIVIAALVGVFMSSNQSYRQNEALGGLQDNARFALDSMGRDLAMAGYWGGVRAVDAGVGIRVSADSRDDVAKASAAGDCGPTTQATGYFWLFDVGVPIVFRNHRSNNTGSSTVTDDFACLPTADIQPNTDVLMIRRVSGIPAFSIDSGNVITPAGGTTVANRFYVRTNQNTGSLFRAGASFSLATPADCPDSSGSNAPCPPNSNPVQVYAYTPQIYYIRNYMRSRTEKPKIPVLCRRYLKDTESPPKMEEDCLAEGVENLQVEWGIGSQASTTVENYLANPSQAQLMEARTARIHILVRATTNNVAASSDAKVFSLADLSNFTPPADDPPQAVLRRAFTTTVQLKNLQ